MLEPSDKYAEIDYADMHALNLSIDKIATNYLFQALIEFGVLSEPDKVSRITINNDLRQRLVNTNVLEPVGLKFKNVVVSTLGDLESEAKIDYYSFETIRLGLERG